MIGRRGPLLAGLLIAAAAAGYARFARITFEAGSSGVTGWDVAFDVITNPLFLGQVVLAAWSLVTIVDIGRALDPQRSIRAGSRTDLMSRELTRGAAQLLAGGALLLIAIGGAGIGLDWSGWGRVSLSPMGGLALARAGWAPVPLLAVSLAQAIACFLAVRAVAVAVAVIWGSVRPAIAALSAFWFTEALSSLYVSAGVPVLRYLGPIFSTERVAPLGLTAPVVIGAAVLLIAACCGIATLRDRAAKRFAVSAASTRIIGWSGFVAVGMAAAADTFSRQPRTLVDAWSTLLAAHSPDLLTYALSSVACLGYALAVIHKIESQFDGRVWIELIRFGSWRKWLRRHLARPLLLTPVYLTALLTCSTLAASRSLGPHGTDGALPAFWGYVLDASLQICLYTAVAVAVALVSGEVRAAWIALGVIFLAGSPFVPNTGILPIGLFQAEPNWAEIVQQSSLLLAWLAAGMALLELLTRKRILNVAA